MSKITKGRAKPHVEKTRKKDLKRKHRGGGLDTKWLKWQIRKMFKAQHPGTSDAQV